MELKTYRFRSNGDDRGQLVALEELKNIPFDIKRVYYIYNTIAGVTRGKHAHRKLQQILICVSGSCRIRLDDGYEKKEILLDDPTLGLYISNDTWREMYDFTPDAVLLVLASEYYNVDDYIRDYDEFLKTVKGKETDK